MRFRNLLLLLTALGAAECGLSRPSMAQGTASRLCSAGAKDGQACSSNTDCPGGVCVVIQAVCDGGGDDGFDCDCPGSSCGAQPACANDPAAGTCGGGAFPGDCCDVTFNCSNNAPCRGTQKVCLGGQFQGYGCLKDGDCDTSTCGSTGRACSGDGFACVNTADCLSGTCQGPFPTPTPSPSPTPGMISCIGDCNGSGQVTVDELVLMVNIALGTAQLTRCPAGDPNGDGAITIEEIVAAVSNTLNGCPAPIAAVGTGARRHGTQAPLSRSG